MGLGVLSAGDKEVPGTCFVLVDAAAQSTAEQDDDDADPNLKYDRSGKTPILLIPQPTDDPNDPLNLPLWRRDLILCILCLVCLVSATVSPLLAANTLVLAFEFERDLDAMAVLTGYNLLAAGLAGFLFVASAKVWGKRHLYLLGTVLLIISSVWGGSVGTDYGSLLGARILQGIGFAPFEALVNASVGDLFFVHERGKRMALSNMSLFGGSFFTPILAGKITATLGWHWTFYLVAIFAAVSLPLVFFLVPETAYPRPPDIVEVDVLGRPRPLARRAPASAAGAGAEVDRTSGDDGEKRRQCDGDNHDAQTDGPAKVGYARGLLPVNGRKTDEALWKLVLQPLPLFLHPAIVWACLTQGALVGWTVIIGVVLAALVMGPPLWFDVAETGYMYAGPFIGAFAGFILSGLLADWSTRAMIRKNKGVYEPEFRMVLVVLQLATGCTGLYGFGYASANAATLGWFLPAFFFALEVCATVVGAVASALYIVDAYREIAVEAFTCLLIFKNVLSYGLATGAFDWLSRMGVQKMFTILGSVQAFICLLSIPMYVFGKRNRAFMHRHDLLKMAGLR